MADLRRCQMAKIADGRDAQNNLKSVTFFWRKNELQYNHKFHTVTDKKEISASNILVGISQLFRFKSL
jgi:hypothetical protein